MAWRNKENAYPNIRDRKEEKPTMWSQPRVSSCSKPKLPPQKFSTKPKKEKNHHQILPQRHVSPTEQESLGSTLKFSTFLQLGSMQILRIETRMSSDFNRNFGNQHCYFGCSSSYSSSCSSLMASLSNRDSWWRGIWGRWESHSWQLAICHAWGIGDRPQFGKIWWSSSSSMEEALLWGEIGANKKIGKLGFFEKELEFSRLGIHIGL